MTPTLILLLAARPDVPQVQRDVRYADPAQERQVLDVYAPPGSKDRPVVV